MVSEKVVFEAKKLARRVEEHSFSVEMKSEKAVRKMSLSENENEHFFFEGYLGKLENVFVIEGMMLQMDGANGTLRLDITEQELLRALNSKDNKKQESEQQ
jgi:hypothetical protein